MVGVGSCACPGVKEAATESRLSFCTVDGERPEAVCPYVVTGTMLVAKSLEAFLFFFPSIFSLSTLLAPFVILWV